LIRHRKLAGLAALAAFFMAGLTLAWTQTGEPTVETRTFTHEDVVTFTVPTETVVSTQTVTVTETVTTTAPTTTAPPTTTEPDPDPPDGTVITLVDQRFVCTGPLSALGELPIILEQTVMNNTAAARHIQGLIDLRSGCSGDGNPDTTDLVIHQYGNGRDVGAASDGLILRLGSHDLNITGFIDCGFITPGAHQDGLDLRGGRDVTFTDFEIGDWETQSPTCHGAGGLYYVSAFQNGGPTGNDDPNYLTNILCLRCKMVASKGAFDPNAGQAGRAGFIVQSVDSGAVDSCFAGHLPFQIRLDTPTLRGAIRPIDINNVKIDTDSSLPQPDPEACEV
jgi:hypothetical protein